MRSRISSYKVVFGGLAAIAALTGSWSVADLTGGGGVQPAALMQPASQAIAPEPLSLNLHAQLARLQARASAQAAQAAAAARTAQLQQAAIRQASPTPPPAATQAATPPPAPQTPPPGPGPSGSYQDYAAGLMPSYGWDSGQMGCLIPLWNQESGWNPLSRNPQSGAYGIPQALPGDKMASAGADWQTNGDTQIRWGLGYIKSNYGDPCGAWAHEQASGWY